MALIHVPERRIRRDFKPDFPVEIDYDNPLTRGLVYLSLLDSTRPTDLVTRSVLSGPGPASPAAQADIYGRALKHAYVVDDQIIVRPNTDAFLPSTGVTFAFIRRRWSATLRPTVSFGYYVNVDNCVRAFAPYDDGVIYWDWGSNSEANGGRLVISGQTWNQEIDYFVFIAGPNKGREVWRNGVKIGSNATATQVRPAYTGNFLIGSMGGSTTSPNADEQFVYMFGALNREWSDAECKAWFKQPYRSLLKPEQREVFAGIASTTTYFQTLSATSTATASITKRISVTHSATSTATATVAKQVNKIVSAAATGAASILKSIRMTLSATSTGTATLVTLRVLLVTLSATATATASMVKRIAKTVSASSTATASMTKRIAIQLAAASTATAQVLKTIAKTLSATATGTATLATLRVILMTLTATSTAVASIGKRISKTVSVTSTATASMTKRISLSLAATSTAVATLTKRISLTLAATSTAVATMVRDVTVAGLVIVANAARTVIGLARRRLFTGEKRDRDHEF